MHQNMNGLCIFIFFGGGGNHTTYRCMFSKPFDANKQNITWVIFFFFRRVEFTFFQVTITCTIKYVF